MKKLLIVPALFIALVQIGAADKTKVSRASISAVEQNLDKRVSRLWTDDPFLLLGNARGVYLEGYGAVFTAEVNLVTAPGISPFHQQMTKQEIANHRQKKLERLPQLKTAMREMLVSTAASLDNVPSEEHIVLGITLARYPWEDGNDVPSQIVMLGQRGKLSEMKRTGGPAPASVIEERDF